MSHHPSWMWLWCRIQAEGMPYPEGLKDWKWFTNLLPTLGFRTKSFLQSPSQPKDNDLVHHLWKSQGDYCWAHWCCFWPVCLHCSCSSCLPGKSWFLWGALDSSHSCCTTWSSLQFSVRLGQQPKRLVRWCLQCSDHTAPNQDWMTKKCHLLAWNCHSYLNFLLSAGLSEPAVFQNHLLIANRRTTFENSFPAKKDF